MDGSAGDKTSHMTLDLWSCQPKHFSRESQLWRSFSEADIFYSRSEPLRTRRQRTPHGEGFNDARSRLWAKRAVAVTLVRPLDRFVCLEHGVATVTMMALLAHLDGFCELRQLNQRLRSSGALKFLVCGRMVSNTILPRAEANPNIEVDERPMKIETTCPF